MCMSIRKVCEWESCKDKKELKYIMMINSRSKFINKKPYTVMNVMKSLQLVASLISYHQRTWQYCDCVEKDTKEFQL
jgi:hypothetical protein